MKKLLKLVKKKSNKKGYVLDASIAEDSGTQYTKLPNVPPLSIYESTSLINWLNLDLFR